MVNQKQKWGGGGVTISKILYTIFKGQWYQIFKEIFHLNSWNYKNVGAGGEPRWQHR